MVLEPLLIDRLGWNRLSSTVVAAQLLELGNQPERPPDSDLARVIGEELPWAYAKLAETAANGGATWTQRARSSATRVGSGPALALSRPPTWPWIAPGI